MGEPMNYGPAAPSYAIQRWAVPWKLEPLVRAAVSLVSDSAILEVGCGTGDYLEALHRDKPRPRYHGLDISPEMLSVARARCPWAVLAVANADTGFPVVSVQFALVYAVDVLHHLKDYNRFFSESARVLQTTGRLVVITDSEEDIRARTLAQLFPATVPLNLRRYPKIERLLEGAADHGFRLISRATACGCIDLDDRFMRTLATKAISELRLISDTEHQRGMARAETLRTRGETWLSQTTVLEWTQS